MIPNVNVEWLDNTSGSSGAVTNKNYAGLYVLVEATLTSLTLDGSTGADVIENVALPAGSIIPSRVTALTISAGIVGGIPEDTVAASN